MTTTTEPVVKDAVLMLNTKSSANIPMVIGYNGQSPLNVSLPLHFIWWNKIILGEVDDDINFTYDANTEVYYSCAASLNDEMWVLGGQYKKRQVNFNLTDIGADIYNFQWLFSKFILDEQSSRL